MTLTPEQIGDKGQRYEVHCAGYCGPDDRVIGWSVDVDGAIKMATAIMLAPSATDAHVIDRDSGLIAWQATKGDTPNGQ